MIPPATLLAMKRILFAARRAALNPLIINRLRLNNGARTVARTLSTRTATATLGAARNGLGVLGIALGLAGFVLQKSEEVNAEAPPHTVDARAVSACLAALDSALPGSVSTDPLLLRARSKDISTHPPHEPFAVVFCASECEVSRALSICNTHRVPAITHASLTSLEGQTVPTQARGIVIDVSQMNATIAIHERDMQATVQAGKSWNELNEELEPLGLMLGPDPGLGASIGGMCATSCSGTRAWRYGTMKENVVGMRVVLPSGEIITTRRRPNKSSAGYDLTRLMIGSEGTLGIITQVTVKLVKIPEQLSVAMFSFADIDTASHAVHEIVTSGLAINRLELMDSNAIRGANLFSRTNYPESPMLLVEYAGSPAVISEQQQRVESICTAHNSLYSRSATTPEECTSIWDMRRNLTWSVYALRSGPSSDYDLQTTDVGVPHSALPILFKEAQAWKEELGITMQQLAHAGDATHHSNTPILRTDPVELAKAEEFARRLALRAIELGGTCTAEHGVGLGKNKYLEQELGKEAVDLMRRIKTAVDPKGVMNPGHVLPDRKK